MVLSHTVCSYVIKSLYWHVILLNSKVWIFPPSYAVKIPCFTTFIAWILHLTFNLIKNILVCSVFLLYSYIHVTVLLG